MDKPAWFGSVSAAAMVLSAHPVARAAARLYAAEAAAERERVAAAARERLGLSPAHIERYISLLEGADRIRRMEALMHDRRYHPANIMAKKLRRYARGVR